MEFHISRQSRDKYGFTDTLFSLNGNVIFANMHAVREFTALINSTRAATGGQAEKPVQASQIYAMGLIDEIFHYVVSLYRKQINPDVLPMLLEELNRKMTPEAVHKVLAGFCEQFPVNTVYNRGESAVDYLAGITEGNDNSLIALEELLMLWLANINPAYMRYAELFDDSTLRETTDYSKLIEHTLAFFQQQKPFGPENKNLVAMLRRPSEVSPQSIQGQLEYIRNNWGLLLGELLQRLLGGLDFISEETKPVFAGDTNGTGKVEIPDYATIKGLLDLESERFSPDREWMPSLVLIAKNAYVWLNQLSRKYNRQMTRLDEIPDEELDFLAYAGITGLWLIGLWQRSKASERIKRLCGNPEAVASAYSIDSYRIADDLGGEGAFNGLRDRAWKRGIRMASDMVPNHFGIDSDWVLYQPDKFLSLDYCPFPSYTFYGENLSPDPAIGIHLEDHYFSRSDASVVFKREDYNTGDVRYIYHGNDGTVMPWNDTAQLNYLKPEVREAIIQIILQVARRTPIIRFDAAMTLAKKHIQRLWFPEPGSGGAIPTRSDHSLSRADFDRLLPEEFWREVVDRVAAEVPDTLLLAEAFWLMEGYFVRTLGMHRVYNSAFMHMLRNEDNANFKLLIKNTLEFDPDILKRYVNFMNNPDEKTAIEQFGGGDKYFGVCQVMSTLPGLPMFGHGQLEGFKEKYGMEYRRAYLEEEVNEGLLGHHYRIIFPLLRNRAQYSGSENFRLYDLHRTDGSINEDVIAYSNNFQGHRSLVVYHNKFADTSGWIRVSSPFLEKSAGSRMVTNEIGDMLGCSGHPGSFLIYRELNSGLQYIREAADVRQNGLHFDLHAYDHLVFGDFFEVHETGSTRYTELCRILAGRGVPDIFVEMQKMHIQPLLQALTPLMDQNLLDKLQRTLTVNNKRLVQVFLSENREALEKVEWEFHAAYPDDHNGHSLHEKLISELIYLQKLVNDRPYGKKGSQSVRISSGLAAFVLKQNLPAFWLYNLSSALFGTTATHSTPQSEKIFTRWFIRDFMNNLEIQDAALETGVQILEFLTADIDIIAGETEDVTSAFAGAIKGKQLELPLKINYSEGFTWFNREAMEMFVAVFFYLSIHHCQADKILNEAEKLEKQIQLVNVKEKIIQLIQVSEYKLDNLLETLKQV